MFTLKLTKEEFKALWETLYEKENSPPWEDAKELSPGFTSLCEKIRQGPLRAVDTNELSKSETP